MHKFLKYFFLSVFFANFRYDTKQECDAKLENNNIIIISWGVSEICGIKS